MKKEAKGNRYIVIDKANGEDFICEVMFRVEKGIVTRIEDNVIINNKNVNTGGCKNVKSR